jgi:heptosyltransferase-2
VNWLGDAVMTTPALQRLREHLPQARITLLTHEKLADLWQHHPCLDAVLTFAPGASPWSVGARLRAGEFDTALILPNSPRSVLEIWLAGIPTRCGYARPWRNWLLTHPVAARLDRRPMRKRPLREIKALTRPSPAAAVHAARTCPPASTVAHQSYEYLHLAAALGADSAPVSPGLAVTPEEVRAVAAKFALDDFSSPGRPILGLNPGAEYGPAKRWPADRFIAAAQQIQARTSCTCLILGGPADIPVAETIHSALLVATKRSGKTGTPRPTLQNLAGRTSLRELMSLLKLCRALLTNDSGPMHVAAALGTPVVVPFGSTSPELTGPGLPGDPRHQLLQSGAPCAPCFRRTCPIDFRCMNGIKVEQAVGAVLRLM